MSVVSIELVVCAHIVFLFLCLKLYCVYTILYFSVCENGVYCVVVACLYVYVYVCMCILCCFVCALYRGGLLVCVCDEWQWSSRSGHHTTTSTTATSARLPILLIPLLLLLLPAYYCSCFC